ncbi:MAG: outer membrane lipoprotein carrier protein LolA [bacterium]|nr:outer membrane lipoprotein carrier protein LolA [bacterium]
MNKITIILIALCMSLLSLNGYAEQSVEDVLSKLEEKMSDIKTLKTGFVQEKKLAIFDREIILKGKIFLKKPDLFAWHTEEPTRYSMIIRDDVILQWDEDIDQVQKVSMKDNPAFQTVVGQMRKWLSGIYMPLLEEYNITVLKQNPVSLKFTPRENTMAYNIINYVRIVFREDERYIHEIYIKEKTGDSTLLRFNDTMLNTPIDDAAWEVKPRG